MIDIGEMERTSRQIRAILAGRDPRAQSAILAELLSIWVAGLHPLLRAQLLTDHIALVQRLIPVSEKEMFGPKGHPGWTQTAQ
jgi:hypothetical protein